MRKISAQENLKRIIATAIQKGTCLNCTLGYTTTDGHRRVWANGANVLVHRFVYAMHYGMLKTTDVIRHSCDNPVCIEITHLLKGSHQDNKNDSVLRKRHARGITHSKAKLTEKQVYEIRASKLSSVFLAKVYGIAHQNIQAIKNRKHWKHLPEIENGNE